MEPGGREGKREGKKEGGSEGGREGGSEGAKTLTCDKDDLMFWDLCISQSPSQNFCGFVVIE